MQTDNVDEEAAKEWLRENNHNPVQCEDDPPDYLIDGDIAVEVTRVSRGEESTLEALKKVAEEELREYVFPGDQPGWDVYIDCIFGRSLPETEETKKIIRAAIRRLIKCNCNYYEDKNSGIKIEFWDNSFHSGFELRQVDFDGGVWAGDVARKIQLCIEKKTDKIKSKFHQHKEWWLLLVDHTHLGFGALVLDTLRNSIGKSWSRVVVLGFHRKGVLNEMSRHRQSSQDCKG